MNGIISRNCAYSPSCCDTDARCCTVHFSTSNLNVVNYEVYWHLDSDVEYSISGHLKDKEKKLIVIGAFVDNLCEANVGPHLSLYMNDCS